MPQGGLAVIDLAQLPRPPWFGAAFTQWKTRYGANNTVGQHRMVDEHRQRTGQTMRHQNIRTRRRNRHQNSPELSRNYPRPVPGIIPFGEHCRAGIRGLYFWRVDECVEGFWRENTSCV